MAASTASPPRMVGGGEVGIGDVNDRTQFSVNLLCQARITEPNEFQIRRAQVRFDLKQVTSASCSGGPNNGVHERSGVGVCEGQSATIAWRLQDGDDMSTDLKSANAATFSVIGTPGCQALTASDVVRAGTLRFITIPNS